MTYLPRRPAGLRADQCDAWEDHAADQYGGPEYLRTCGPDDVDPEWAARTDARIAELVERYRAAQ